MSRPAHEGPGAAEISADLGATKAEVVDLVAAAMEAHESGGEAALERFCAGLGRHEDEVRAGLEALRRFGLLVPTDTSKRGGDAAPLVERSPGLAVPERLGDFELHEPLGRGGMGIVYRARQCSLDREVAVKLIRPEQLYFPGVRERFQREVEIVAKLQHEGIVRLYSFGEDHGIPWFAMERVHGVSLAEVIQRFGGQDPRTLSGQDLSRSLQGPLSEDVDEDLFKGPWVDVAARVIERAALALDEAHRQGVLHRDLKPSNIMLTPRGRVVLLDFGLAWSHDADRITRSGTELGTLHYMAPEQFRGAAASVDERTDVYSLGVVLRELVTLRPVFTGTTIDVVARQVREGDHAPFRQRGSSAAVELATVCLVAMDRDPERRYPTARALARDLRNLLERRPIAAVRPKLGLRLRRYLQRHPAVAAASSVALAALLAAPLVVALRERGLRVRLEQANEGLSAEIRRADANLSLASDALAATLTRIDEEQVVQVPDLRAFVDDFLVSTSTFLDALLASNPRDPEARLRLAETLRRVAIVRWQFYDLQQTESLFQRVLELLEDCVGDPDRLDSLELEARLALAYVQRQPLEVARQTYEQALASLRVDRPHAERGFEVRVQIAQCLERHGELISRSQPERGRALMLDAQSLQFQLASERPSVTTWLEVMRCARALALERERARDDSALETHENAIDHSLAEAAVAATNASPPEVERLAEALHVRATRLFAHGRTVDALRSLEASSHQWQRLITSRPSRLVGLLGLLSVRQKQVTYLLTLDRADDAAELLRDARARATAAFALWPEHGILLRNVLAVRRRLAETLVQCTVVAPMGGRQVAPEARAEADAELLLARELVDTIEARAQRGAALNDECSRTYLALAILAARDGAPVRALEALAKGERLSERALSLAVEDRITLGAEPRFQLVAAEALLQLGRDDEALARLAGLRRLPHNLLEQVPSLRSERDDPRFAAQLARAGR
jgi:serine/threonine protein kinase